MSNLRHNAARCIARLPTWPAQVMVWEMGGTPHDCLRGDQRRGSGGGGEGRGGQSWGGGLQRKGASRGLADGGGGTRRLIGDFCHSGRTGSAVVVSNCTGLRRT